MADPLRSAPPSAASARLGDGLDAHRVGDLERAEAIYREILTADPRHADALHLLGLLLLGRGQPAAAADAIGESLRTNPTQPVAHLNLGVALQRLHRPAEATASFESALRLAPDYAEALNNLGDALLELRRPEEALAHLTRALHLQPRFALAWSNRGNALRALDRPAEALESYEQALRLQPDLVRAWNNRGNALRDVNRVPEALASFQEALRLDPGYAQAFYNLGNALLELERYSEALACYEQLLRGTPHDHELLTNRGITLLGMKRFDEALASLERALALRPDFALAHNNRGNALRELKRPEEALECYAEALRLLPDDPDTLSNRGNALSDLRRYQEALASYEAALERRRDKADIYHNRGNAWQALRRPAEALADFERALALKPQLSHALFAAATVCLKLQRFEAACEYFVRLHHADAAYPFADGVHLHARLLCCDWQGADAPRRRVLDQIEKGATADQPFSFLAVSDDPEAQLRCARALAAQRYPPPGTSTLLAPWSARRYGHSRVRVAYISGDLRNHVVSRLLAGVWEQHDRRQFEIIAVALNEEDTSPFGQRVRGAFDRYIDASGLGDAAVTRLLRDTEVDIAVDLMGYTDGHRTGIFAPRAAPVQINYLGFPGTLGAAYFDYLLADRFVVPPHCRAHYAEQVVYLPDCFQANDTRRATLGEAPSRTQLGLPDAAFVWCCLNSPFKLNPALFQIWMRLLREVPASVLWLLAESPSTENNLRSAAVASGVDASRLVFAARVGYEEHVTRLARADVFLDTLPFNAGATASDALWVGLPVLTCVGGAFASRMAGSLLQAVGLPELICESLADYEQRALELARRPDNLAALKDRLTRQRRSAPLFDTRRFCGHLEAAYLHMWRRSEDGEPPASFAVE